jgi:Cys-rich four helix bundle protein (predicted Tat secretion target)
MKRRGFFGHFAGGAFGLLAVGSFLPTLSRFARAEGTSGADALAAAASDCVRKGETCLQHCMTMLSSGDTEMAACAKSVREMLIYCEALEKAAAQGSPHLRDLAKIAAAACADCEAECRKHEKHAVCKACADACVECGKRCKAVAA